MIDFGKVSRSRTLSESSEEEGLLHTRHTGSDVGESEDQWNFPQFLLTRAIGQYIYV